jgi:DNA-binding NarL/FixJ family response regulator
MMIRILVVDDHAIVRESLRGLIERRRDWQVCGEAANGREAIELVHHLRPDIVVLDLSMSELNGIEATSRIRKMSPGTEVLVFTMHDGEDIVREVIAAGARGYLLKSDGAACLEAAIEMLAQHQPYFAPAIEEMVLATVVGRAQSKDEADFGHGPLTVREREVVQLLAEGKSSKQIAKLLGLTAATVQTHRATIMRKLNVGSITELVRYAVRNKIIEA